MIRFVGFDHSDGIISKRCFRKINMVVTLKWEVIKFCLRWKERKQGDFNLGKLIRRHN